MERPFRLMLVGEDRHLSRYLENYLQRHGYQASAAWPQRGLSARIGSQRPDLVILDPVSHEDKSEAFFQDLRASYQGPLLLLSERTTAKARQSQAMLADGYVSKPIDPQALLVGIRTLLKRFRGDRQEANALARQPMAELRFGSLLINSPSRRVLFRSETIHLSSAEFDLLSLLAEHAGQILDRDTINRQLRGIPYDGIDRSIDVGVSRLRKKLGDTAAPASRIKTVWGKGYLFVPDAWD